MKKQNEIKLHGECIIAKINKLPKNVKPLEVEGPHLVVADSETLGNFHIIEKQPGVKFFQGDEIRYLVAEIETEVKCVNDGRHDAIVLSPGIYELDIQQEFDYFAMVAVNVRD